jgi:polyisoprenoid-binding protein YceI
MQQTEKILLKFAIIGTLLVFGMASISYVFFDKKKSASNAETEVSSAQAPAEDSDAQPMSTGDGPAFAIDPAQSEVRFSLGETLGGQPVTVVGITNDVSGTLYFSSAAPQAAEIGEILVDARGLETDNSFRNRAIHGVILVTNSYPTIGFVPVSISGLPEAVVMGEPVTFDVTGELTIKDVTRTVTFSAEVTLVSETQIAGHAATLIAYDDYGIFIPSAPRVADVDEEVLLEIDFVALAE